jgi:transposase
VPPISTREAELLRKLEETQEQVVVLREALEKAQQENTLLRQKIDLLVRRIFGASSEKLDAAQLELLLGLENESGKTEASSALEEADPASCKDRSRQRGNNEPRWPSNLQIVEEIIEPAEVQTAPQAWRFIGEEVSEQLDYEPARFLRRRLIRRKYVHRQDLDRAPVIAALPEKLQERCLAAPGLLAQIIVSKYCDHLPLYRQEQIYWNRHRVKLSRQTMATWMGMAADCLEPIYKRIRTGVMAGGYVQIDETPIEYLCPGHGQTKLGYLWTCSAPGGDAVYHWQTSRAASCLQKIVPDDFRGVVQCDGYAAYGAFARERGEAIALAGCFAHARRNFYEAREGAPQQAGFILRQMQHLYRIEKHLREQQAGRQLRAAVRTHQSRPIHERIHRALVRFKLSRRYLPQSSMGQAIDYALAQWPMLSIYLEDGRVEIDNNLVENAIRPTAIGKKNWLFIGEANAGDRGAILYTIVESCRRRGIDPYRYLRELLTALPAMTNWQIKDWTPEAWAKAKLATRKAA